MRRNYNNLFVPMMLMLVTGFVENFWGHAEMQEQQQVHLKVGNYAVTLYCFLRGKCEKWITAEWERPDMSRRSFLPYIIL